MTKVKVPANAINPFLFGLNLDWFLSTLSKINKDKYNIYLIHDVNQNGSGFGSDFIYKMRNRKISKELVKIDAVDLVGIYDDSTFIVASEKDILDTILESLEEINGAKIVIVATLVEEDNNHLYSINKLAVGMDMLINEYGKDEDVKTKIV